MRLLDKWFCYISALSQIDYIRNSTNEPHDVEPFNWAVEARHSPSCDHNEVNDGLDGIPNILWRKEKLYNMCKRLGGCLKGSKEVLFQNITVILASTRAGEFS